ncbi:MAG: hypothetical protein IKU86_11700 [Thermoguttaceae bacterium]|nr:hypothetical protein [Thermoguttaceae bacterium]
MIDAEVKKVVYVAGWNSARSDFAPIEEVLKQIYPNATIERFEWDSDGAWTDATQNAELAAQKLRERLSVVSSETLRSLVLIGHSLGARVAIRAVSGGTTLRRLVLLGAAVDRDSRDVARAAQRSELPLANVYSPFDVALTFYRIAQGRVALGQKGASGGDVLNVPALNGSFSQAAVALLVPLAFPLRVLAALANAALQSHSFCDYLKAWRDFNSDVRRAVVEPKAWRDELPSDVVEAIADALTRWPTKRTDGTLAGEPCAGVRKISAVVSQLGPSDFDWNCVVESLDAPGAAPKRTVLPLNVDGSWEALPEKIRAEFLKTNRSSCELIIYN